MSDITPTPNAVAVPLAQAVMRPPEHGRIRMGHQVATKSGDKMRPASLETFRFTSPDQVAIEQIAEMYGGNPRPWHNDRAKPKDQWEVIVTSNEIDVWLPSAMDPVSQFYEMWDGGGCQRRCDGLMCQIPVAIDEYNSEYQDVPCLCNAAREMNCKPTTRLVMVLPGVKFGGVWRLESKGEQAAVELPSMAELVRQFQQASGKMLPAVLSLTKDFSMGGQRQYVVPKLSLKHTPEQLMGGASVAIAGVLPEPNQVAAIEGVRSARAELANPSPPGNPEFDVDEEVAEVVDVDELIEDYHRRTRELSLTSDTNAHGLNPDEMARGICLFVTRGKVGDFAELSGHAQDAALQTITDLEAGVCKIVGVTEHGTLQLRKA